MDETQILNTLSSLGTPAQFATLALVLIALIKVWPIIQKQLHDITNQREGRYGERIKWLESELHKCHEECTEKIKALTEIVDGLKAQRIAEQIAMMRVILRTIDDPSLRKQLEMLEALQMTTDHVTHVGGPIKDGGNYGV
jgi:RNA binding exosome subunit